MSEGGIQFDIAIGDSRVEAGMRSAVAKLDRGFAQIKPFKIDINADDSLARLQAEMSGKFAGMQQELDSINVDELKIAGEKAEVVAKNFQNVATALVAATLAAKALDAAASGINLGKALFADGDRNVALENAKGGVKSVAEGLDVTGLGRASRSLATSIFGDYSPGNLIASATGAQTDNEVKAFDEQMKRAESDAVRNLKRAEEAARINARAANVARQANLAVSMTGKSTTEKAVISAQADLDAFNQDMAKTPAGVKQGPEVAEARAALEAKLNRAMQDNSTAQAEATAKGIARVVAFGKEIYNTIKTGVTNAIEARIHGEAQIKAIQLATQGDVDGAERARLEESIRRRLAAAEKVGAYQVQIVQDVAIAEREQLEKRIADRNAAEAKRDAADQKSLDERNAAKVRQAYSEVQRTEDLKAQAEEKRLRRTGRGEEADVMAIERRAEQAIKDAKGDKDRIAAIMANAEEDVRAIQGDRIRETRGTAVSARDARSTFFGGDNNKPVDKLTGIQEKALAALQKIAANPPGVAMAG